MIEQYLLNYGVLGIWTATLLYKENIVLKDLKKLMIEIRTYFRLKK